MPPPRRILVISTNMLGDTLMMTPVIRSMRTAWPDAEIDVLLTRASPQILEGNPDISSILQFPRHPNGRDYLRLFKQITRRYDLAISNQTNDRIMLYSFLAAPRRIGRIVRGTGLSGWWRTKLLERYMLKDHNEAVMLQNMRLLRLLKIPEVREVIPPQAPLPDISSLTNTQRPLAIVHPIASSPMKYWTHSAWCQVIDWLWQQGLQPVLSGGPNHEEQRQVTAIASACSHPVLNFAGKLSLGQWSQLLRQSKVYVGADTSMSHLAAACGTPCVTLFSRTPPSRWGPWPKSYQGNASPFSRTGPIQQAGAVITIQGSLDCVPCGAKTCLKSGEKKPMCLEQLPAKTVISALQRLLTECKADCPQAEIQQPERS